jgi:hypothetical protein
MRALSAGELLGAWERGLAQGLVERALTLLAAACDARPDALASLTIGQRDACLLTLREWTFGSRMSGVLTCPGCGERLELTFDVAEVRADAPAEPGRAASLAKERYDVQFRPPDSTDLASAARESDPRRLREVLLERCLLAAHLDGEPVSADRLPPEVVDAVAEGIAEADPQADVELAVSCASCGHPWRAVFDIVSFFWGEIDAWACRILREVHALASAYRWAERDILALSPQRRQLYLDMVGGERLPE